MQPEIWPYYRGYYKVYTEDYDVVRKIASWEGCRRSCTYYAQNGRLFGWDLIFPSNLYNKVARLVGLPARPKDPNRVAHGEKLGRLAKENDVLRLQNKG